MPALAEDAAAGLDALHRLKTAEAPLYLSPSPELSSAVRLASKYLFSSLKPYTPKSPFNQLLTDGFDAEQIWQQIDLQAQPLLSSLRRHVRNFEKNPEEIEKQFNLGKASVRLETANEDRENKGSKGDVESESDDFEIDDDDEEEEDEEHNGSEDDEDEDDEENSDEEDREIEKDEKKNANIVEDKFLKIKELEEYLVEDEAREYGEKKANKNSKRKRSKNADEDEDSEDEDVNEDEDDDDEDKDDELGLLGLDDDDGNEMENARYEDFFGGKKTVQKKKPRQFGGSDDDLDMDDDHTNGSNIQKKQSLSTHEKEQEKLRSEIKEMEKANLEPKAWTMQGEVTADKRPKNSALSANLDVEYNVRPAQVITEEFTASLEELILKRIPEGRYDDAQKPSTLLPKGPREKKELDESKSKKGLAELYEDDYAQKTGLVSAALTFSDEQKKEASTLFKNLCVKLDALSHFHFTPKPVIEDMSIQANVPALAMEEIAPLAVSDAAMLAPEEVFSGKGDVKEESELTKEERKRRRANKKRKFKAKTAKQRAVKAQLNTVAENAPGDPL